MKNRNEKGRVSVPGHRRIGSPLVHPRPSFTQSSMDKLGAYKNIEMQICQIKQGYQVIICFLQMRMDTNTEVTAVSRFKESLQTGVFIGTIKQLQQHSINY